MALFVLLLALLFARRWPRWRRLRVIRSIRSFLPSVDHNERACDAGVVMLYISRRGEEDE
jgi:hypothetical protein